MEARHFVVVALGLTVAVCWADEGGKPKDPTFKDPEMEIAGPNGRTEAQGELMLNDYEINLHKRLFTNFNSDIHPFQENEGSVVVLFDTQLIRIIKVSEREQFIQVYLWINQYWRNKLLSWNPDEFGGLKEIYVFPKKVWVPDIVLYNNVDDDGRLAGGLETYKAKVRLTYDGNSTWLNPIMYKSICRLDVSFFPFDDQECSLKFGSWAFDASKIDMRAPRDESASNSYYIPNGEWKLLSLTARRNELKYQCCPVPYVDVTVTISLRREALSYTLNLVIPCALLSSLIILGFILPPESGERIGLSITVLLSVTVFQQLTSQLMPTYDFPYLAQYYLATILETGLSLVVTTIILNFYHSSERPMPRIMKRILLDWLAPVLFCSTANDRHSDNTTVKPLEVMDLSDAEYGDEDVSSVRGSVRLSWADNSLTRMKECGCEQSHNNDNGSEKKFSLMRHKKHSAVGVSMRNNAVHSRIVNALAQPASMPMFGEEAEHAQHKFAELRKKFAARQRKYEWMKAARVLDRFFFIFFIIMSTVTIMVIFLRAPRFKII